MNQFYTLFLLLLISCATTIQKSKTPSYDAELSNYTYPFKVKNFKLSTQRQLLNFRYMDLNSTSNKVIVLLHGKNFAGFYWEQIANDLVEKDYRVIIPDQIGFGKSSKPSIYQYSFAQLAINTNALLDSLKIQKYTVVGHSMGGMLAVHMTTMYTKNIQKLVLINPIGLDQYLKYVEFKDPNFFYKNEVNKSVDMFRSYQRKNYYDGEWNGQYEKLLMPFKGWKNGPDWEQVAWSNALTYSPIFTEDIVTKFKQITTSTILIIGTRDKTGPGRGWKKPGVVKRLGQYKKLANKTNKMIKGSKLYKLDGLGHMPQFENYSQFKKVFFKHL